jgi:hypothetical protein
MSLEKAAMYYDKQVQCLFRSTEAYNKMAWIAIHHIVEVYPTPGADIKEAQEAAYHLGATCYVADDMNGFVKAMTRFSESNGFVTKDAWKQR